MNKAQPLALWQLILMQAYYESRQEELPQQDEDATTLSNQSTVRRLVSRELLITAMTKVEQWLQQWQQRQSHFRS